MGGDTHIVLGILHRVPHQNKCLLDLKILFHFLQQIWCSVNRLCSFVLMFTVYSLCICVGLQRWGTNQNHSQGRLLELTFVQWRMKFGRKLMHTYSCFRRLERCEEEEGVMLPPTPRWPSFYHYGHLFKKLYYSCLFLSINFYKLAHLNPILNFISLKNLDFMLN